jgi:hypothetical protein
VLPAGAMNSQGEGRGGQAAGREAQCSCLGAGPRWRGLHQVLYCVFSKGEMVDEPEWTLVMPVPDSSRPPVFTNRCCRLVSDQWAILRGNTKRRHRLPRL